MPPKGAKILCDQGVSRAVVAEMQTKTAFEYHFAYHEGVSEIPDDDLLTYAEKNGFTVIVTTDKSMVKQQNMQNRKVGVVVLGATDTAAVLPFSRQIIQAIQRTTKSPRIVLVPMEPAQPVRPQRSNAAPKAMKTTMAIKTTKAKPQIGKTTARSAKPPNARTEDCQAHKVNIMASGVPTE
jgi:predicted nuclease of predicted toxin-antitoxin system